MKRYEKMTPEEVYNAFTKYRELPDGVCIGCVVRDWEDSTHVTSHRCLYTKGNCNTIIANFLNEDVEMKKRWELIDSDETLKKMFTDWHNSAHENKMSFAEWLCQEVEA